MAWDSEKADAAVAAFKAELEQAIRDAAEEDKELIRWVQEQWKATYQVSGHKRLARAFLDVTI